MTHVAIFRSILNDFMIPDHYKSQVESLVAHGQVTPCINIE